MLPIMIRADEEAMRTVRARPLGGGDRARGAARAGGPVGRAARGPSRPGDRQPAGHRQGAGETAPLLFTLATPLAAMTLLIYTDGTQAFPSAQRTAWATALVLLSFVLLLSVRRGRSPGASQRRARLT